MVELKHSGYARAYREVFHLPRRDQRRMPRVSQSGQGEQQQTGKGRWSVSSATGESGRVKDVGARAGQEPRPAYWLDLQPRKGNAGTNKARWQTDTRTNP